MTRRSHGELERRLANLEERRDRPHARPALDADVPDELVGRIIQSSRAHLDDPTDREVALESILRLQQERLEGDGNRDAADDTPRFE